MRASAHFKKVLAETTLDDDMGYDMGKQLDILHSLHSRGEGVEAFFELVDAALFRVVCGL